jgi:type I restriction enzyme S subunit
MREGWEIKKLGEVCDLMTGGTPSKSRPEYFKNGDIKWLVSGDIHKREIFDCEGRITKQGFENSNVKFLPINSVLIALNGQGKTRGTVALLRTKATCNQSLVSISPKKGINVIPEYLFCNLYGRYEEIRKITGDTGNDRRGLNMPLLKKLDIPIAPLSEQKRIVEILDKAFAAIDKAKANVETNLENAQEVFDSYAKQVFKNLGGVTKNRKLGEVCGFVRGPFGGSLKKNIFKSNGYAVYEQQHAIYDQFDDIRYFIDESKYNEMKRFAVSPGDLIMSCSGTMGRIAIVPQGSKKGIINQALLKLAPDKNLSNMYLKLWMQSDNFQNSLKDYSGGAAIQNVASVSILKDIEVPVPPIDLQAEAVQKIEAFKFRVEKLGFAYQQKLDNLGELKKSILQKVFSGNLH